jgi:uncharacterized protein (DUF1697 family)
MTTYVALLRAVNVGGTGALPMRDLKRLCERAGFQNVRTYIASGNVVFDAFEAEAEVKSTLKTALLAYAGKPIGTAVRSSGDIAAVLAANPFPDAAPSRVVAIFLDAAAPPDALERVVGLQGEALRLGLREIYVHYGAGMARSKLRIPAAAAGTARNMNTVARLAAMAAGDA